MTNREQRAHLIGFAIEKAWNDGTCVSLPPIDLSAHEREHIGRAAIEEMSDIDSDIETRFWAVVDRDGLTGLPSDMWAALDILVQRDAERSAQSEPGDAPTPPQQSAPAIPAGMAGVDTETAAWAWLDKKFGTANDDPVDRAYDASEMVDAFHAGHALRITPKQPSAPASDVLREVLDDLQKAEAAYRKAHDLHGDGDRYTGRMWDLMRRAGDKARATLSQPSAPSQEREG